MERKKLVSIIIPCFNQENFIQKAIESVLEQTYSNWECIIIDDGSTDNSAKLIEELIKEDERCKYVYQNNLGVSKARNHGFSLSKGSYIQFLDSDDWLHKDKLQKQVNFLEDNPNVAIVYSNHFHYYQNKDLYEQYRFTVVDDLKKEVLFEWDRAFNIPPHAPLYRKTVWKESELPHPIDYNLRYEDWVFWAILGLKNCAISNMDENLAYYRVHGSNFTSSYEDKSINALLAANYISGLLNKDEKVLFMSHTISYYLNEYYENKSLEEFKATLSWKLGKKIAPTIYWMLPSWFKKKYHIYKK